MKHQSPSQPHYITKEELEEILDRKLDEKLDRVIDEKLAAFFAKFTAYYDERFKEWSVPIEERAARAERIADATQQRLERVEQEGIILGSHVDRHDTWIHRVTDTASQSI